jgi:hypothetical protein
MKPVHHQLTIGFRLSTAIVVLFLVTLIISAISLWQLRSAEGWLETIHRETLAEVSSALELSAGAANLATTAPFLLTVQLPFQLQVEADEIVSTIANLETMAKTQSNLTLSLARLRDAISDLIRLSLPQRALEADITQIDLDLARLERQFARAANSSDFDVEDRLVWAKLRQLTSKAQDIARAQTLIDVSEYSRMFANNREALMFSAPALILTGLAEMTQFLPVGQHIYSH